MEPHLQRHLNRWMAILTISMAGSLMLFEQVLACPPVL
jgi:hypothetical protein